MRKEKILKFAIKSISGILAFLFGLTAMLMAYIQMKSEQIMRNIEENSLRKKKEKGNA